MGSARFPDSDPARPVRVTLDGREVVVPAGTLLIEAAKRIGIVIPHFCYHERLVPIAACRFCLVEVEGMRGLQPACATVVSDGMVVRTATPAVADAHAEVVDHVLAYHPLDCPKCERSGCCMLQDFAYEWASKDLPVYDPPGLPGPDYAEDDWSPVIRYDPYKCVRCYRCTRACDELADVRALTVAERGHATKIATFAGEPLACDFCGMCVEVCPTGAITQWPARFLAKDWEYARTEGTCAHCSVGCRFEARSWEGRIADVRTKPEVGPANFGNLCAKGRYGFDFGEAKDRLTEPLLRRGGALVPVSWEEALGEACGILGNARRPVVLASGFLPVEDLWVLAEAFPEAERRSEGAEAEAAAAYAEALGLPYARATAAWEALGTHEAILVAGFDPWDDSPVLAQEIARVVRVRGVSLFLAAASPRLSAYAEDAFGTLSEARAALAGKRAAVVFSLERILFGDLAEVLSFDLARTNLYPVGLRPNGRALSPLGFSSGVPSGCDAVLLAEAPPPGLSVPAVAVSAFRAPYEADDSVRVLLPAATPYERDGTFVNFEGRPQFARALAVPPGEAAPPAAVFAALAARLGRSVPDTPEAVREAIASRFPFLLSPPAFEPVAVRADLLSRLRGRSRAKPLPVETMFSGPLAGRSAWIATIRAHLAKAGHGEKAESPAAVGAP